MRKLFMPFIFLSLLVVISCHKDETDVVEAGEKQLAIPAAFYGEEAERLGLPSGTKTEVLEGGTTVRFILPHGVKYYGPSEDQEWVAMDSEYTCTGKCTTGCDVMYIAGSFGCSQCDPSTVSCTGSGTGGGELRGKGGYVDFNSGISLIRSKSDEEKLINRPPDGLFKIPEVIEAMQNFNLEVHGTTKPELADDEYVWVKVNLLGSVVAYKFPKSKLAGSRISTSMGEDVTCECTGQGTGCDLESGWGYKKCVKGECTSCTMTVSGGGGDEL